MKHLMFFTPFLLALFTMVFAQSSFMPGQGSLVFEEKGIAVSAWEADTHDFGEIPQGEAVSHRFVFTNTGNKALTIEKVEVACGCTAYAYSKEAIQPGEQGFVTATYNAKKTGRFIKPLTVFTDEEAGQQRLVLKGEVLSSKE
ncbi:MAG: DUF1573 domain-containing protein [Bacteroidota bacterium]